MALVRNPELSFYDQVRTATGGGSIHMPAHCLLEKALVEVYPGFRDGTTVYGGYRGFELSSNWSAYVPKIVLVAIVLAAMDALALHEAAAVAAT